MPASTMPPFTDVWTLVSMPTARPAQAAVATASCGQPAPGKGGEEADHQVEVAERQHLRLAAHQDVVEGRVRDQGHAEYRGHHQRAPGRCPRRTGQRNGHPAPRHTDGVDGDVGRPPLRVELQLEHRDRRVGGEEHRRRPRQLRAHGLSRLTGIALPQAAARGAPRGTDHHRGKPLQVDLSGSEQPRFGPLHSAPRRYHAPSRAEIAICEPARVPSTR